MNKKGLGLSVGIASVVAIGTLCQPHLALAEHTDEYENIDQQAQVAQLRDERVKNVVSDDTARLAAKEALNVQQAFQRNNTKNNIEMSAPEQDAAQEAPQYAATKVQTASTEEAEKKASEEDTAEETVQLAAGEAEEEAVEVAVTAKEEAEPTETKEAEKEVKEETKEQEESDDVVRLAGEEAEDLEVPKVQAAEKDVSVPMDGWLAANMNIRLEPNTDSAILGVLNLGTKVSGRLSDGWLAIEYNDDTAYISADYISQEEVEALPVEEEPVEATGETAEETEEQKEETAEQAAAEAAQQAEEQAAALDNTYNNGQSVTGYTTISLNVRDNPSMDSNVIGVYPQGTKISGQSANGWVRVEYNGNTAYIAANRVTSEAPAQQNKSAQAEQTPSQNQQVSGSAQAIVDGAYSFLGSPYVFGAADPSVGFDCSGLAYYLYRNYAGITLNRSSYTMVNNGYAVSRDNLRPGDLLFFNSGGNSGISHVGIYVGNGQMIHASTPETGVIKSSVVSGYHADTFVTARRILN